MDEFDPEVTYLLDLKSFSADGIRWFGDNELWVQQYPYDSWSHPLFTDTIIDHEKAVELKNGFDTGVRGQKIYADYEHGNDPAKGRKAAGEVRELKVVDEPAGVFTKPGLWARVQFTDLARQEIDAGEWNYWSTSHWDEWTHPQTNETYKMVYNGGALTNTPYVKDMVPLNFSEVGLTEDNVKEFAVLSAAQRKALPDSAYMYTAPDGTRMFPFKHKDGSLDKIHLQKIIQLAPRAKVPDSVKSRVIARAKRLLGVKNNSEVDALMEVPVEKAVLDEFGEEILDIKEEVEDPNPEDEDENGDEGGEKDVALEAELREKLGLTADDDLVRHITGMHDELEPLREAAKKHSEKKTFAEMFPEQATELKRLKEESEAQAAKKFAEGFKDIRLTRKNGDKDESTTLGLSGLAIQKLEDVAKKFNEGDASIDDVRDLMDAVTNSGVVDYGTTGSSRERDIPAPPSTDMKGARKQFSDLINSIMEEDSLDFRAAMALAAERDPELASAYHSTGMG